MKNEPSKEDVPRIWKHSVLPYIEERLFGDDTVKQFRLKTLCKRSRPTSPGTMMGRIDAKMTKFGRVVNNAEQINLKEYEDQQAVSSQVVNGTCCAICCLPSLSNRSG